MSWALRIFWLIVSVLLIAWGALEIVQGNTGGSTFAAIIVGVVLMIAGVANKGRRLFADEADDMGGESVEIMKDLAGRGSLKFYSFANVLFKKSSVQHNMDARRERVAMLRRKQERDETRDAIIETDDDVPAFTSAKVTSEDSRATPVTVLNSAWTWTFVSYVLVIAIAIPMMLGMGLNVFSGEIRGAMSISAVVLIYPAWRIGSLLARFLKARGFGAGFSMPAVATPKASKTGKPGSVEARMAERRARVAKAREEGKL